MFEVAMYRLHFLRYWQFLSGLLILTVWYLSLTDRPPSMQIVGNDKIAHALAYGVQMVWFAWLYPRRRHALVALCLVAQGILLEVLQNLEGVRVLELADMLANMTGVVLGWGLAATRFGGLLRWIDGRIAAR